MRKRKERYDGARALICEAIAEAQKRGHEQVNNLKTLAEFLNISKPSLYTSYKTDECTVTLHAKLTSFIRFDHPKP